MANLPLNSIGGGLLDMVLFKCRVCGEAVEVSKNDVDLDCYVEELGKDFISITVTATMKCPSCGEPLFEAEDTIELELE